MRPKWWPSAEDRLDLWLRARYRRCRRGGGKPRPFCVTRFRTSGQEPPRKHQLPSLQYYLLLRPRVFPAADQDELPLRRWKWIWRGSGWLRHAPRVVHVAQFHPFVRSGRPSLRPDLAAGHATARRTFWRGSRGHSLREYDVPHRRHVETCFNPLETLKNPLTP